MRTQLILLTLFTLAATGFLLTNEGTRTVVLERVQNVLPEREVTFLFTGDVMLDRGVANHASKHGDDSLFRGVESVMKDVDAVVVNLETTLSTRPSVAAGMDLRFTSDPRFAKLLMDLNVDVATLSNNHTDDFGAEGLNSTREYLTSAGIEYFGSPHNREGELSLVTEIEGLTVCFVGYEGFIAVDPAPIAEEIRRIDPGCTYMVATMHAGEEYTPEPSEIQVAAARAFIDAGADVVVGSHPHIVQPLELYKGKPIFYSLGNFMFDQDFSWETTHGLLVEAAFTSDAVSYTLIPTDIVKAEASVSESPQDIERTLTMLKHSSWSEEFSAQVLGTKTFTVR